MTVELCGLSLLIIRDKRMRFFFCRDTRPGPNGSEIATFVLDEKTLTVMKCSSVELDRLSRLLAVLYSFM